MAEIKQFSYNDVVHLLYKNLLVVENIFTSKIQSNEISADFSYMEETDLEDAIKKMQDAEYFYSYECTQKGEKNWGRVGEKFSSFFMAYNDVLRWYEEKLPKEVSSIREKCWLVGNALRVDDKMFEYQKNKAEISGEAFLNYCLADRLIIALKQPNKPYAFDMISANARKNMGQYYRDFRKDENDFYYTTEGFVEHENYVNMLRTIVSKPNSMYRDFFKDLKDNEEQDIEKE